MLSRDELANLEADFDGRASSAFASKVLVCLLVFGG
jgi:hypothetical protein